MSTPRACPPGAASVSGAPGAARVGSLGLSNAHISPLALESHSSGSFCSLPPARLVYAKGGSVARLKGPKLSATSARGKRGTITLFSRASQQRLRVLLASINRDKAQYLPLLLTLTYPSEWSPAPTDWKRDLDTFSKRLAREYPAAAAVWVLEFQKRGAPHFHLLVFGVARIDYRWLGRAWYEIVGSGDEKHLRAGTRVEQARKWNALQAYVSKYVSKNESKDLPVPDGVGRWWGVLGRSNLEQLVEWVETVVPLATFWQLRRVFRSWVRKKCRRRRRSRNSPLAGIVVFMPAAAVARLL